MDAASYSGQDALRDGRRIEIRALKPEDEAGLLAAVGDLGAQSLYRRFHGVRRHFSEREIAGYVNVDFVNHVALVALIDEGEGQTIIGGARYVVAKPGSAELAFAVVDRYQGQKVGGALLRHLIGIARAAGLRELTAEVLAENRAMLRVFEKSGLPMATKRQSEVVHVTLTVQP
jgi:GNAT superfamily N-acetyltransferase